MSSTVIAKNIQIGTSGTATNNFNWYQPASPDGTVRLGVGNYGATTLDVVTVSNTGVVTFSSPISGSGASLTNLNASNISTGTIPSGILAVTQAAKTSSTTIATTAFVDQLRSLLTATTGSGGGTAVIGDRGCLLSVTAGVTVPANVFAANDTFSIYNNTAGNITITQGGSLTLRQVGTANTGNRTLAQRGLVTVVFISATEAVISGGGLT